LLTYSLTHLLIFSFTYILYNLVEVYKGGDIDKEIEVKNLLAHISHTPSTSSDERKINQNNQNMDVNRRKEEKVPRMFNSPIDDIHTSQKINIDSVVSSLDTESGYDEVRRYYGMSYQNTIPPGNLYSLRQVIAETELVEEIKLSRKNKINARHERQKLRDGEDGNVVPITSSSTSSSTSYTSSARPQKIHRPPRVGIEDSPNRGRVWVHNSAKGSSVSTGASQG
jgi:hypothetical protein